MTDLLSLYQIVNFQNLYEEAFSFLCKRKNIYYGDVWMKEE